jgi:DNA modification methylase
MSCRRSSSAKRSGATRADSLSIELWPIERVIPYENNPRVVPKRAIEKVAASIRQFGWRQPIVVDTEGVIAVGHTRLLAARKLGYSQVPVHVAAGLSPAQIKAYRLADNRAAAETDWDAALLGLELSELAGLGLDLGLTGFEQDELARYLGCEQLGLTDPDFVPAPPEQGIVQSGDLWGFGPHRLLCDDARSPEPIRQLMGSERALLMATDPPYLVDYDGGNHPQTWGKDGRPISSEEKTRHWDSYVDHDTSVAFYEAFLKTARECALAPVVPIYMFFGAMRAPIVFEAWERAGLLLHQILAWHKSRVVLGRCDYCWNWEPIAYGWIKGSRPAPERRPPANATTVWEIASTEGNEATISSHPTVKPVALIRQAIEYHTLPGELIYEPFAGSGTAIIAAEMTARRCFAVEISPAFCDVALRRYEQFSGRKAVLLDRV